jgi:hypothetical protein
MEEEFPEKRWVRFRKRTHREGVFEALWCPPRAFGTFLGWFGNGFQWALGFGRGIPRYLNPNGRFAASQL